MHVENISFHNPYYNVELMTDYRRDKGTYQYDQDQDGRFFFVAATVMIRIRKRIIISCILHLHAIRCPMGVYI